MSTESDQADVSPQRFDVIFTAESVTRLHWSQVNQFFFIKMQSYASTCRKKRFNKTVDSAEGSWENCARVLSGEAQTSAAARESLRIRATIALIQG